MHLSTLLYICVIASVTTAWGPLGWWKCGLSASGEKASHAQYSKYQDLGMVKGWWTVCDRLLPINRCCKFHRKCYKLQGYTQKACDNQLEVCLEGEETIQNWGFCKQISKAFIATVRKYGNYSYAGI
ncbi:hypothetical protein PMAYCL1PPCAC_00320, partial [Pristionchus mayeri]